MFKKCSTESLKTLNLSAMCVKDLYAYIRAFGTVNVYKQIVPTKPYIKKNKLKTIAKKIKVPKTNVNNKSPNQLSQNNNKKNYKAFMNDLIKAVLNNKIGMNEVGAIRTELRTQANKARFNQALNKAFTKNVSRRSQRSKKTTRRNNFVY